MAGPDPIKYDMPSSFDIDWTETSKTASTKPYLMGNAPILRTVAAMKTQFENIDKALSSLKQTIQPSESSQCETKAMAEKEPPQTGLGTVADQETLETIAGLKTQFKRFGECLISGKQLIPPPERADMEPKTMTTVERLAELNEFFAVLYSILKLMPDTSSPEITALKKIFSLFEQRLTTTLKIAEFLADFNQLFNYFRQIDNTYSHTQIDYVSGYCYTVRERLERELELSAKGLLEPDKPKAATEPESKKEAVAVTQRHLVSPIRQFGSTIDDDHLYDS